VARILIVLIISLSTAHSFEFTYTISKKLKGQLKTRALEGIEMVKEAINKDEFWNQVEEELNEIEEFSCLEDGLTSEEAFKKARHSKVKFTLSAYRTLSPSTNAVRIGSTIKLNKFKKNRSSKAWASTLIHEMMHVAGFGHCGLNDRSKHPHILDSVPYVVGDVMFEFLK
jgi:uncharacterized protein YjaZ